MAKRNDGTVIAVIVGIILLVILLQNFLPSTFHFPFAVQTTTTCSPNVISNWEFKGNTLDINNVNDGVGSGITYVSGKFGQAVQFGNGSYINFPSGLSSYDYSAWASTSINSSQIFYARINGTTYANGAAGTSIIPTIGSAFGNGTTLIISDLAIYSNLSVAEMVQLYANATGNPACYITQTQVNVTCANYATQNMVNPNNGTCLFATGDFYPNCSYNWQPDRYYVNNNNCVQNTSLICSSGFSSLSLCQSSLTPANTTTTPTTTQSPQTSASIFTSVLFTIPGINLQITLVELFIILIIAAALYMLLRRK